VNTTYQISWLDACPGFNRRGGFRAFRGFRGFLPFFAVLALFAIFLAAASPAPAQTTTTLLDIRSPATADPPSMSLLTVSDAGDLWIKGALVEYAYPGTITLDPSRQYWTLRDSDGNVLWALEVYNPSTGISTGNLLTVGTFESYCYNAEQQDAIFRVKTPAGTPVFTLNAVGRVVSAGQTPIRQTAVGHSPAASYTAPTPDAYAPAPDFREDLVPYLNQVAQPPYEEILVSIPQAQARIYYGSPPYDRQDYDVTNTAWRRRWEPGKTTLDDYDIISYGLRCTNALNLYWYPQSTPDWIWAMYIAGWQSLDVSEYDARIYWDDETSTSTWLPVEDVAWSEFSHSSTALTSESLVHITVTLVNPDCPQDPGNADEQATAESDLFLYAVDFTGGHPAPGSYSRNTNDTRRVNVGCRLLPEDMPTTWVQRIELTLWDPAYVGPNGEKYHRRVFLNTESECTSPSFVGKPFISKMWDGKLYLDGVTTSTAYYTQASDFFMSATVYWNPAYPPDPLDPNYPDPKDPFYFKPWESESDEFPEPRVAFTVTGSPAMTTDTLEVGSEYTFSTVTNALPAAIASYQWDFQGKAFQTADHDVYDSSDLLTAAQKTTANVTTKFITGEKSLVANTDLGTRTVQLTVTDTSQTLWTSTLRPYLLVNKVNNVKAKVTFYYVPYEANGWFSGQADLAIQILDGPSSQGLTYPCTLYSEPVFAAAARLNGTGKLYRIRTVSGSKESGDDNSTSPSLQYIKYCGDTTNWNFHFVDGVFGGISPPGGGNHALQHQDAARYHFGTHRSYYNRSNYRVVGLYNYVEGAGNVVRSQMVGESSVQPCLITAGEQVSVWDSGPFALNNDPAIVLIDEKHLDLYMAPQGSAGIDPRNMDRLGTVFLKVSKP